MMLEFNDSALKVIGDRTSRTIAHEAVAARRKNVAIVWTTRDSVHAQLRALVKCILRKHGDAPD